MTYILCFWKKFNLWKVRFNQVMCRGEWGNPRHYLGQSIILGTGRNFYQNISELLHVNTTYCVSHLYATEFTRLISDKRHAMILVSWIETLTFIRDVIIFLTSKSCGWKCKIKAILTKNENKRWDFFCLSLMVSYWMLIHMIPSKMGKTKYLIFYALNVE